jgi:hypothetical protein
MDLRLVYLHWALDFLVSLVLAVLRAFRWSFFGLDIRISNHPCIDICKVLAAETGLQSTNIEKRRNTVSGTLSGVGVVAFCLALGRRRMS